MSETYTERDLERYNVHMHEFMSFNTPKDTRLFSLEQVMSKAFAKELGELHRSTQLSFVDYESPSDGEIDRCVTIAVHDNLKFEIQFRTYVHNDYRGEDAYWEMSSTVYGRCYGCEVRNVAAAKAVLEHWRQLVRENP